MKKSLFAFLMIALFATTFTSCKKDEGETKVEITDNSFAINGVKIDGNTTLGAVSSANLLLLTSQDSKSTVTLMFKAKPTASGSFNFKGLLQAKDLGDNDLILAVANDGKTYASTSALTQKATVTVNSAGKLTVSIPEVEIADAAGGTATIKFQGKLVEF
ncbi:MAG: hypothetical protein M9958_08355 [Chitinophagales bacterium]|nr:hypothetical protein [Chitinophagales bacterium]